MIPPNDFELGTSDLDEPVYVDPRKTRPGSGEFLTEADHHGGGVWPLYSHRLPHLRFFPCQYARSMSAHWLTGVTSFGQGRHSISSIPRLNIRP
jgi:hypothetical protein